MFTTSELKIKYQQRQQEPHGHNTTFVLSIPINIVEENIFFRSYEATL